MTKIGNSIQDLDTPSLLLDIDKLTENVQEMAVFAKEHGLQLRPHVKTHKSINIAKMQLELGAIGITTAKVAEAEVMAAAGIRDILIAYPISSKVKIQRVAALVKRPVDLKVAVDSIEQLRYLQECFEHEPFTLKVWMKVNSGLHRCGVEPGKEVLELAKAIQGFPALKLDGIFTHAGHSYAARSLEEVEKIGLYEGQAVAESAFACERIGIPIPVRSVGSTPTYQTAGKVEGINEIRPGNAVFFDAIQAGLGVTNLDRCALSVLASVVGVYHGKRIVFDTGSKALCLDKGAHGNETVQGFGHIIGHPELLIERLSEEHGVSPWKEVTSLRLNDKVQIIPNHACTVANQFDRYLVHQHGKIIAEWKVDAKGMMH